MKKILFLLFLLGVLTSCSNGEPKDDINEVNAPAITFEAVILENNNHFMVEPVAGTGELKSSDKIIISTSETTFLDGNGKHMERDDFQAGQKVQIRYNGVIAESYPAQIHHCDQIQLMTDKD